jgi:hypothetical protein
MHVPRETAYSTGCWGELMPAFRRCTWLIAAIAMVGCAPDARQSPAGPAYKAEMTVEGYTICVELFHNHEFLAEYRKVIKVEREGKLVVTKEYLDTGGFASFYVLRAGNHMTVVDGILQGFVVDLTTGATAEVDSDTIPKDLTEQCFGRFMFVQGSDRRYKWVPGNDLPKQIE